MKKLISFLLLTVSLNAAVDYTVPTPMKIITPVLSDENIGQTIVVSFVVKADGKIENINVQGAFNYESVDKISTAISKWEYFPKIENGKAVDSKTEVRFLVGRDSIKFK